VLDLSLLAKGFLTFSHPIVIVPLLLIGLVGEVVLGQKSPCEWRLACLLVLFSMILNVFLKSLFLVPLNPALGKEGFAFPSGHMQVSVVLYGYLLRVYVRHWIRGLLILSLLV